MANALVHQRCGNHALREAVARCPECRGFFCRECVTEHEDRLVCAACLRTLLAPKERKLRLRLGPVLLVAQGAVGLLLLWFGFYLIARVLLWIPAAYHEATLWAAKNL